MASSEKIPADSYSRPSWIKRTIRKRIVGPLQEQLRKGIPVKKISHSMSIGIVASVYPQIGCTTLMGLLLGFLFRLNHAAIQAVKFALAPLQFVFMIPFLRLGEFMVGGEPFRMPLQEILKIIVETPLDSFRLLWMPLLHAILGWLCACAVLYPLLYISCTKVISQLDGVWKHSARAIKSAPPKGD